MKLGIRSKLFLISLALVAAALIVAEIYVVPKLDRVLTDRIRDDLFVRLALCEQVASSTATMPLDPHDRARLAQEVARRAAARVTLIAKDGKVVGDSDVPERQLGELEDHNNRPEVQQARASPWGSSIRYSTTLGRRMMYVAMRGGNEGEVIRLAVPLTEVDNVTNNMRGILATGALLMLLAVVVLSSAAVQWMSQTLRGLTRAAQTMADGDFTVRTRVPGHDEIASLSAALDRLAQSLTESLSALRGERDLLDRILAGMSEGVLLLGGDGRVLMVNPSLREMLLLGVEIVGKPLLEAIRHGQLKDVLDNARAAEGSVSEEIEIRGLKPRRLLLHVSRLGGEPADLLAVFVDVTEIRRLESLRKDLVANASHELRTPIATVRAAAETLVNAMRRDPKQALSFVDIIVRNSQRLQQLVDDLLDLSRIESKEFRLHIETVEIDGVIERVCSQFQQRAESKRIRLAVDVPAGLSVRADRRALEQVLSNLVDNAVKYCPENATISVGAVNKGEKATLVVGDTGPGIDAKHLPHLFERFYRVDSGRSRELGGTGLGLSIVKHLVEAMQGAVDVESAVGEGSQFMVSLPRAPT